MIDILGNTRTTRANRGDLASSEFALITLGDGQVALAQGFDSTLQVQVRPVFELGSTGFFWNFGFAQGQANLSKLAGAGTFFAAFKTGNCGIVDGLTLSVAGGRVCAANPSSAGGMLRFSDGVIESLGLRMQAGTSEITESAGIRYASLAQ